MGEKDAGKRSDDRNAPENTPLQGDDQFAEQPTLYESGQAGSTGTELPAARTSDFRRWSKEQLIAYATRLSLRDIDGLDRDQLIARIKREGHLAHFSRENGG